MFQQFQKFDGLAGHRELFELVNILNIKSGKVAITEQSFKFNRQP